MKPAGKGRRSGSLSGPKKNGNDLPVMSAESAGNVL